MKPWFGLCDRRLVRGAIVLALWLWGSLGGAASAELPRENGAGPAWDQAGVMEADSPLSIRQERVRRLMQEIPPRLLDLSRSLESIEPRRAARLQEAIVRLQQMRIDQQMGDIARLLAQEKFDPADAKQQQALARIQEVIALLLAEDAYSDPALAQWMRLEAWRRAVDELIERQSRLHADLADQRQQAQRLVELDALVAAVRSLIQRQKALRQQTQALRSAPPGRLAGLSSPQHDLEKQSRQTGADSRAAQAAHEALAQAAQAQGQAAERLSEGRGQAAEAAQARAIAALEDALRALGQERVRIAGLPDKQWDALAAPQTQLAQEAQELEQQMGWAEEGSSPSLGQAAVGKAKQAMRQAGDGFGHQQPDVAALAQQEALRQLQEARRHLEQQLEPLRRQAMEERLAGLESRLGLMLERQRPVTGGTRELSALPLAQWSRAQTLACATLAQRQTEIADLARQCMDVLRDDATTVVFPHLVRQVERDMQQAGQWLAQNQADRATLGLQQEIQENLEELLAAVQAAREHLQQQAAQGDSSGQPHRQGTPALAPPSAELRLLKSAQVRINRRTAELDAAAVPGLPESRRQEALDRLTRMQQETAALARKAAETP